MYKATQTFTALIVLLGLLSLFSLCLGVVSSIKADKMGQMANCGMSDMPAVCPIAAAQHLNFLQNIVVNTSSTLLLLALIVIAAITFGGADILHNAAEKVANRIRQRLFEPTLLLGDYLKQAFSQGILHPKIY